MAKFLANKDETYSTEEHQKDDRKVEEILQSNQATYCMSMSLSTSEEEQPILKTKRLSFPFLTDENTIKLIKQTKIMIVMRGLPCSGKSIIVKKLQDIYHPAGVCSADNCFVHVGCPFHHKCCNCLANTCFIQNVKMIIIDLKYCQAEYYFDLASKYNYIVLLAIPKTPWRLNPTEFCNSDKYCDDCMTIHRDINFYKEFIPFYYAWFVNENWSSTIEAMGKEFLKECLELYPRLKLNLLSRLENNKTGYNLKNYFNKDQNRNILHCTSMYIGSEHADSGEEYHNRQDVQNSYGYAFTITIFGFTITGDTLGARIHLPPEALILFYKPEELQRDAQITSSLSKSPVKSPLSPQNKTSFNQSDTNMDNWMRKKMTSDEISSSSSFISAEEVVLPSKNIPEKQMSDISKFFPLVCPTTRGRSAHLTLGTAFEIESKQTSTDLLDICDIEKNIAASLQDFESVQGGKSRCYDENHCCIYLDSPINLDVIFTGFY